jgi:hypothetical protein
MILLHEYKNRHGHGYGYIGKKYSSDILLNIELRPLQSDIGAQL